MKKLFLIIMATFFSLHFLSALDFEMGYQNSEISFDNHIMGDSLLKTVKEEPILYQPRIPCGGLYYQFFLNQYFATKFDIGFSLQQAVYTDAYFWNYVGTLRQLFEFYPAKQKILYVASGMQLTLLIHDFIDGEVENYNYLINTDAALNLGLGVRIPIKRFIIGIRALGRFRGFDKALGGDLGISLGVNFGQKNKD